MSALPTGRDELRVRCRLLRWETLRSLASSTLLAIDPTRTSRDHRRMGHDEHFLHRLDRVSDHHVELSLTLYRDQDLLRDVLARAALPEGSQRLAISLDDPREGPFVIVTREGRFVTCLAKGMTVGPELMVLPRTRLDAAIAKVERMRERIAKVEMLRSEGANGIASKLFIKMFREGLTFCREDAETLLQVWPLVGRNAVVMYHQLAAELRRDRDRIATLRFDRIKPHEVPFAASFGSAAWGAAHLIVLTSASESAEVFEEADRVRETDLRLTNARTLFELGSHAHALRALWSLARRQKPLPPLRTLRDTDELETSVIREFGLGVVAMHSSKHRAEATKEISRVPPDLPPDASQEQRDLHFARHFAGRLGDGVRDALIHDKEYTDRFLALGRGVAASVRHGSRTEPTEAMLADISDQVAGAMLPCAPFSWFGEQQARNLRNIITALPWLAQAKPADLFLPRAFAEEREFSPVGDLSAMMIPYAKALKVGRPDPVKNTAPKPGRNDPCACGSGKKTKRCCG